MTTSPTDAAGPASPDDLEPDVLAGSDDPSRGELELEERTALRRISGLSTELTDVTEVEYRQLRLERV
ncbi:MAG: GTPase HflX, partial [Actinomycetota bacterium]|nr:GTPase HflX [Actinomycetota bacterium]